VANKKQVRKKSGGLVRRRTNHIGAVINRCIAKFHMIGTMNHLPTAFHWGDIALHLKGMDLKIGYENAYEFLAEERKPWTLLVIHFFKTADGIEAVPLSMVVPDATLIEIGRNGEVLLHQLRQQLYEAEPQYSDDVLEFYGYYFTYGDNLQIDSIEDQLTDAFMAKTNNLESIVPAVEEIDEAKVLAALLHDKFRLVKREAGWQTEFEEKE